MKAWSLACAGLAGVERRRQVSFGRPPRVAFVKQSVLPDLYSSNEAASRDDIVFSSVQRSGPVALFTEFEGSFYMVKVDAAPECQVYRERLGQLPKDPEVGRILRKQDQRAIRADSVDWSSFDMVIAYDNAVPATVAERFPSTLWCTMLENHRMRSYRSYLKEPPPGYDCFFNQHFGPTPRTLGRRSHVIDFPFGFNRPGSISSLFGGLAPEPRVVLERHQDNEALRRSLGSLGVEVYESTGRAVSIREHLSHLVRARYFLAPGARRPLWGNATSEAAAAGCLILANPDELWNPFLVNPECACRNARQAIELIGRLENNPEERQGLLQKQAERLDWFCFHRPLLQIQAHLARVGRELKLSEAVRPADTDARR